MTKNNQPIHSIRYGNVRAAIWKNENGYHSVTFERSYLKESEWKETGSFGRDDLPKLTKAAEEAYTWIFRQGTATPDQTNSGDIPPGDYS